jgi:hypothetical protein
LTFGRASARQGVGQSPTDGWWPVPPGAVWPVCGHTARLLRPLTLTPMVGLCVSRECPGIPMRCRVPTGATSFQGMPCAAPHGACPRVRPAFDGARIGGSMAPGAALSEGRARASGPGGVISYAQTRPHLLRLGAMLGVGTASIRIGRGTVRSSDLRSRSPRGMSSSP